MRRLSEDHPQHALALPALWEAVAPAQARGHDVPGLQEPAVERAEARMIDRERIAALAAIVKRMRTHGTAGQKIVQRWANEIEDLAALLQTPAAPDLRGVLGAAHAHVVELREAWERGDLSEHDGQGGTRSNRNVEVEIALRAALETIREREGERR